MPEIKINENIRKYRKEMGIGQETLANALGVTIQAVSKWETAGSMPDITLLPQIAEFFGVTLEELFYGRSEDTPKLVIQPEQPEYRQPEPDGGTDDAAHAFSEQTNDQSDQQQHTQYESHSYSWNDLSDLGKTIGSSISEQVRRFTEEVRENVSGRNFHIKLGGDRWASENKIRTDLPDDKVLRIVQFCGNEIVQVDEIGSGQPIRLAMPDPCQYTVGRVIVYGSAVINGAVGGSLSADGDVTCGSVGGGVRSDGDVECQSVGGNVSADGDIRCRDISGNITADGDVTCGNVMGSVTADGDVTCGNVHGSVRCDGTVHINK